MKAEDLMVGDYISVKPSGMPIKIAAVHHKKVAYHAVTNKLTWVRESLLEPIPVTSEVLEKNGFVKLWNQYVLKADKEPFIHLISLDNLPNANGRMLVAIKDRYTNAKIAIIYVHELQHALRSCKIEKEVEL